MDGGAWWAAVHGVAKSRTGLGDRVLSPNGRGGWTPLRPLRGLQEPHVATREESGVLGFPSRRGLTPRGSLECNPEIPAFPGEEY